MKLDFRNVNTLWGSVVAETLFRLGLTTAIICPGSRSTPLAIAFAQHRAIETIPVLDERSAAFLALGIAKRSHTPVVLICTSGTAGANFYPAVIEARYSHIPLIVFTADRPPELRECHAGQTIDQEKLYGNYPNWYVSLATPSANLSLLAYLRQTIAQAWQRTLLPTPGVVHLNCPFREPLAPVVQPEVGAIASEFDFDSFFSHLVKPSKIEYSSQLPLDVAAIWQNSRGIIIAGLAQPQSPEKYCKAIARLSRWLQFPVLAEALSPLRNHQSLNPYLISTYDFIGRDSTLAAELSPELVIQIGELPTSKQLRGWLAKINPVRYILSDRVENFDPLHGKSTHLQLDIQQLQLPTDDRQSSDSHYLQQWLDAEAKIKRVVREKMRPLTTMYEGKTTWLLSQILPPHTPLIVANSMSVRYLEWFWQGSDRAIETYFSRGANGIDGTLSTALGVAHNYRPSVLLTGDLALVHDTNGFLFQSHLQGHLTIILINNNGGGIFEHLPIAQFEPPFEEFFATPQTINWPSLAQTYGLDYQQLESWQQLEDLCSSLPTTGIRLLELKSDRRTDAAWLKQNFPIDVE